MASALEQFARAYQNAYEAQLRAAQQEAATRLAIRNQGLQEQRQRDDAQARARELDLRARTIAIAEEQDRRAQDAFDYMKRLRLPEEATNRIAKSRMDTMDLADVRRRAATLDAILRLAAVDIPGATELAKQYKFPVFFEAKPEGGTTVYREDGALLGTLYQNPLMRPQRDTDSALDILLKDLASMSGRQPQDAPESSQKPMRPDDPERLLQRFPRTKDAEATPSTDQIMRQLDDIYGAGSAYGVMP